MTLAVQSRLTLDEMQEMVVESFSPVPNNGLPRLSYSHLAPPFATPQYHRLYRIVPTREFHSLEVTWALPSLVHQYAKKPLHYVSHLIGGLGGRGEGRLTFK